MTTRRVVAGQTGRAPAALPAWVSEASSRIDLEALCEVVVARDLAAAFPELSHDEEFVAHLRASARENLLALRNVVCGLAQLEDVRLEQPLAFAALQARLRIPQTALQRSYRVGFLMKWDEWSRSVRTYAEHLDVPREEALLALHQLAEVIFGYQDHVASQVAETYARADDALGRSRAHVRQGLVRELLRGHVASLGPSDLLTLGYDLGASHLVVLLPAVPEGAAAQLLVGLRAASGVQQSLLHPLSMSSTAVWLGAVGSWTPAMTGALRDVLERTGVESCLSEPQLGVPGFRAALTQAQEVEQVRRAWGRASAPLVLQHADVRLEVLLLRDLDSARAFVRAELGPLAEDTHEATRLRETLEASFRYGSHVAAAEHLQLHEHTVRNRLHKAEQQLGHAVQDRRPELQVALRLLRLLGARDADGTSARPEMPAAPGGPPS